MRGRLNVPSALASRLFLFKSSSAMASIVLASMSAAAFFVGLDAGGQLPLGCVSLLSRLLEPDGGTRPEAQL